MDERRIEADLLVVEAMSAELSDYLLGDNLYRQMMVKTPLGTQQPKMTLGALLENLETLHWLGKELSPAQRTRLQAAARQTDLARRSFAASWRNFLHRELKALLGSWRWYLEDAARDPETRENYRGEVHHRTRIDLILRELAGDPGLSGEKRELGQLDQRLRGMLRAGDFVGPRGQAGRYSSQRDWWLYGMPG